jgi:hypothetical protein
MSHGVKERINDNRIPDGGAQNPPLHPKVGGQRGEAGTAQNDALAEKTLS